MTEKKPRPEWCTVISPSEYDIDKHMEGIVKMTNRYKQIVINIDIGMLWGLYESWKDARTLLHTLALGVSLGDRCPFCGGIRNHKEYCNFDKWAKENVKFSGG